jgi:hypothetical protein
MGSPVSGSPCSLQYAVFLFSFLQLNSLQIKSFRPLLLVCLCFHSQSGLKSPEHLKSLHMSSMHHIQGFLGWNPPGMEGIQSQLPLGIPFSLHQSNSRFQLHPPRRGVFPPENLRWGSQVWQMPEPHQSFSPVKVWVEVADCRVTLDVY